MAFDINESITTKLDFKEVALITATVGDFLIRLEEKGTPKTDEQYQRGLNLVNRLGVELYDCPQTEPNGH